MTKCFFTSFAEASAFAKRMTNDHKSSVRVVRGANGFIVEGAFPVDSQVHPETQPNEATPKVDRIFHKSHSDRLKNWLKSQKVKFQAETAEREHKKEVERITQIVPPDNSYKNYEAAMLKIQLKNQNTTIPVVAARPPNLDWLQTDSSSRKCGVICSRCGGDGGVNGGCDKCDGTGWE